MEGLDPPSTFSGACRSAVRGTESYACLRSTKTVNCLVPWLLHQLTEGKHHVGAAVVFVEATLRLRKLLFSYLLQTVMKDPFATTSSRAEPCQLSHLLRSSFLGMGMRMASTQSLGTFPSVQVVCTRSTRTAINSTLQQAAFTISGRMLELPPVFPHFNFQSAAVVSYSVVSLQVLVWQVAVSPSPLPQCQTGSAHSIIVRSVAAIAGVWKPLNGRGSPSSSRMEVQLVGLSHLQPACNALIHLPRPY